MRKLFALSPIFLIIATGACTADFVTKTGSTSAYAPVNEVRGGEIKYLNQGAESIRQARRNDAYQKMSEYCGGKYKITTEGERAGDSLVAADAAGASVMTEHYWHIRFECVSVPAPAEGAAGDMKR